MQLGKIAAHEGCFLGTAPLLELAFAFDRVGDAIEPLREDQGYGSARFCVAAERAGVVLRDSDFKFGSRRADVITAIGTSENVEVRAFGHRERLVLRDDRCAVSSG